MTEEDDLRNQISQLEVKLENAEDKASDLQIDLDTLKKVVETAYDLLWRSV